MALWQISFGRTQRKQPKQTKHVVWFIKTIHVHEAALGPVVRQKDREQCSKWTLKRSRKISQKKIVSVIDLDFLILVSVINGIYCKKSKEMSVSFNKETCNKNKTPPSLDQPSTWICCQPSLIPTITKSNESYWYITTLKIFSNSWHPSLEARFQSLLGEPDKPKCWLLKLQKRPLRKLLGTRQSSCSNDHWLHP